MTEEAIDSKRRLTVILERDEDGWYVASVPELRGCHTQGRTLDEVMENIRDAAVLCLEVPPVEEVKMEFIGVQLLNCDPFLASHLHIYSTS